MQFLLIVAVFAVIVFLYMVTYALNKKVKPPVNINVEGCCGCKVVGCANNPAHHEEEEIK